MSTSAISAAVPVAQQTPAPIQAKGSAAVAPAKPQSAGQNAAAATISAAAAALVEASETSAQTAKEAAGGDRQAQTLLAKEAAAAAARSGGPASNVAAKPQVSTLAAASRPGSLINERA